MRGQQDEVSERGRNSILYDVDIAGTVPQETPYVPAMAVRPCLYSDESLYSVAACKKKKNVFFNVRLQCKSSLPNRVYSCSSPSLRMNITTKIGRGSTPVQSRPQGQT